jgi:hypothetical protein
MGISDDLITSDQYRTQTSPYKDIRESQGALNYCRVWYQKRSEDGNRYDGVVSTSDIGKAGVFVEGGSPPPVASALKRIVVPPNGWARIGVTLTIQLTEEVGKVRIT